MTNKKRDTIRLQQLFITLLLNTSQQLLEKKTTNIDYAIHLLRADTSETGIDRWMIANIGSDKIHSSRCYQ